MIPAESSWEATVELNRKLREIFESSPIRDKLRNMISWLCNETRSRFMVHLTHENEDGQLAVSSIYDREGSRLDVSTFPDIGILLPPDAHNYAHNVWIDPSNIEIPAQIRQRYSIIRPIHRVFFRVPGSEDESDLISLLCERDIEREREHLNQLAPTINCLSCLMARFTVVLYGELNRKQRKFLMHLYKDNVPGLESAHKRVLEAAMSLLDCKRYAIWTVNHRTQTATLVGEHKYCWPELPRILTFNNSFVGIGIKKGEPVFVPNVFDSQYAHIVRIEDMKMGSLVIVPVLMLGAGAGKKVTHVLVMYPKNPKYEFEVGLFQAASERIATYLSNAGLVEQNRFVQMLLECSVGSPDLQEYLHNVVDLIKEHVRVQGCSIFYYDEVWEKLLLGATSGLVGNPPPKTVMYDTAEHAATVKCFDSGNPIRYDDIQKLKENEMMHKYKELTKDKVKTFLAVPIKNPEDRVTGVVRCANKIEPLGDEIDFFSDIDQELLEFVSRIVGYHIELRLQDRRRNDILDRTMHEVYNPASAIRITAQTLRKRRGHIAPQMLDSMLSNIEEYAKLLDWLADSVTYFTLSKNERLKRYRRKYFDLQNIADDVMALARPIAKSRGRDFKSIDFQTERCQVWFDWRCLVIIVVNLVANAIKYFDESVCERFEVVVEGGLKNNYRSDKSHKHYSNALVIRVSDWGIGVSPSEELRIFEPGFQATRALRVDDTGQGLGLALVKLIAEDFDGEVFLENNARPTKLSIVVPQKGLAR